MSNNMYNHVINVIFQPLDKENTTPLHVECNIKSPNKEITKEEVSKAVKTSIYNRKDTHDFIDLVRNEQKNVIIVTNSLQ